MRKLLAAAAAALALLLAAGHSGAQNIPSLRSLSPSLVVKNPSAPTIQFFSSVLDKTGLSTWTAVAGDATRTIKVGNASPYTLVFPGAAALGAGWGACYQNVGTVPVAVTASGSLFEGAGGLAKLTLMPGGWMCPSVDGANYATPNEDGATASCQSIVNYGGGGDGIIDNLAPWNAFAAAPLAYPCISFPPGNYKFSGVASYTVPSGTPRESLTVLGTAQNTTLLNWPSSGNGMLVTLNGPDQSVHIRDMTLTTGVASATTVGLSLVQAVTPISNPADTAQTDVSRVTLSGSGGINDTSKYWGQAVQDTGVSNIIFPDLVIAGGAPYQSTLPAFGGNGVSLTGTSANFAVVANFSDAYFLNLIHALDYNQYVQGVTFTHSNIQGGFDGIVVAASQPGIDQLSIGSGTEFTVGGTAVSISSNTTDLFIEGGVLFLLKDPGSIGVDFFAMQGRSLIEGADFFGQSIPVSFTGSMSGTTMTVPGAPATGVIAAGSYVGGAGVSNPGPLILPYGTAGTTGTGAAGTYAISISQTVASGPMMAASGIGIKTESGTGGGLFVGNALSNIGIGIDLSVGSAMVALNQNQGNATDLICPSGNQCLGGSVGPGTGPQIAIYPPGTGTSVVGVTVHGDGSIGQDGTFTLAATGVTSGLCTNCNIVLDTKGRVDSAANGSVGVNATPGTSDVVLSPNPGLTTFSIGMTQPLAGRALGTYPIVAGDVRNLNLMTNGAATTMTIPAAGTTGFAAGFMTAVDPLLAGTTITPASGLLCEAASFILGRGQYLQIISDGGGYDCLLGLPTPPSQLGNTLLFDNGTWSSTLPTAVQNSISASNIASGILAVARGGTGLGVGVSGGVLAFTATGVITSSPLLVLDALMLGGGAGATPSTLGGLGTATTVLHGNASGPPGWGAVDLATDVADILPYANLPDIQIPFSIGWIAGQNPNNAVVSLIDQSMTISAIVGAVEIANGTAATVTVNQAPSGTACSAGTAVSTSFNANGTPATNQIITSGTPSLAIGSRLCLQTTGGANWTSGSAVGTITVFAKPS